MCKLYYHSINEAVKNNKSRKCAYVIVSSFEGDIMRLCDAREKEVINLCDCKRLGYVEDILFDCCTGKIEAFVVPICGKFCGLFGNDSEFVIPFECVKKIGPDIILVEICEEKFLKSCKD